MGAYVFCRAVCAKVDVGGMFLDTDGAHIFHCWASPPVMFLLLTFGTLVSWAGGEVCPSLVDFSKDQDSVFGLFVVEIAVGERNDD